MPQLPGEATLLSVNADVHYFFAPVPGQGPLHTPHHRFDKGSFVYLFQRAPESTGRLEVANNPGKQDQDALAGTLENASIMYSFEKSTSVTLRPPPSDQPGGQSWKLPSYDPFNGLHKYTYVLESVDIYFWSPEDALLCLNSLKTIKGVGAFNLTDAPPSSKLPSSTDDAMSPIVKRLERAVTISRERRNSLTSSVQGSHKSGTASPRSGTPAQTVVPLAYNPAAPPAPEVRAHREKTPPPIDGQAGIGLSEANLTGYATSTQYAGHSNPYLYAPPATTSFYNGPPQQQVSQPQQVQTQVAFAAPPASQISPPQAHAPAPQSNTSPGPVGYHSPPQTVSPASTTGYPPPIPSQTITPQGQAVPAYQAAQVPLPFSPPPQQGSFNQPSSYFPQQGKPGSISSGPGLQHHGSISSQSSSIQQQQYISPYSQSPGLATPQSQSTQSSQSYQPGQIAYNAQGQPILITQHQHQQSFAPPPQMTALNAPSQQQQQFQQQTQQYPQGYSNYSYAQSQQPTLNAGEIHQQVYVPTETEAKHAPKQGSGWASKTSKAEAKVSRFLQKLDKRL